MIFLKGSLALLLFAFHTAKVINAIPLSSEAASETQSSGRPQYYLVPQHYLQQQNQPQYISAPQPQTYQAPQSTAPKNAAPTYKVAQLLLPTTVDRQVAKAAQQVAGPQYAQEIQYLQQQGLANEAVSTAQRRAQAIYRRAQQQAQQQAQQHQQHQQQQYLSEVSPKTTQYQYVQQTPVERQPQPQQQQYQIQYEAAYHQPTYVSRAPAAHYKSRPALEQKQKQQSEEEPEEEHDNESTYQFGFDVKDDLYTNYQNRKEQREGGKISGSYSVVDSDGFIRTVTYTADPKEGFKAEVVRKPTDIVVKIPKPKEQPEEHQYVHTIQNNPEYQQQQVYAHQPKYHSSAAAKEKIVYRYQ